MNRTGTRGRTARSGIASSHARSFHAANGAAASRSTGHEIADAFSAAGLSGATVMARLATGLVVNALVRRVNAEGGSAMVLAKGDPDAGAILMLMLERGGNPRFFERGVGPRGAPMLVRSGPLEAEEAEISAYWQRRRSRDPDLWVIELDIADAERFAAETISDG